MYNTKSQLVWSAYGLLRMCGDGGSLQENVLLR